MWPSGKVWALKGGRHRGRFLLSSVSHTTHFNMDTVLAYLSGAWHYRVSAGTGRPSVSTLGLGESEFDLVFFS